MSQIERSEERYREDVISVILTPQIYVPWNKEEETLVCGKLYDGRLADVLTTRKPFKVRACLPLWRKTTYRCWRLGNLLQGGQKDKLFVKQAYDLYYVKIDKIADTKPLMYFTFLALIGTESRDIVAQSARYPRRLRIE